MADLASLYIKVDSKGVVTASKDLDNLTGKSKGAEKATQSVTKSFTQQIGIVKRLAAAYGAYKIAQYIKDAALLAARYETLGVVMHVVGKNAGYTAAQMDKFALGLQKTGIAMVESRNTLARMIQAQIDLTNSQKLARIAQDAAVIGAMNSSEAFERMIHGLQTGHILTLRNIGLNVDFDKSVRALADSLGIEKDALSEAQIMQARVNAVVKAGVLITGTYEASMTTAGKKIASFTRYVQDFKVKMGEAFGPATVTLIDAATAAMKEMQDEISRPEVQEALRNISFELADIVVSLGRELPSKIVNITEKLEGIWKIISYDPAIIEYGMVGLILGGKKGAVLLASLAHMTTWAANLSKALGLVSTGVLDISEVATANFKELQELVKRFDFPDPLKNLQLQAKQLEERIQSLKKITEGKIFTFRGDREELVNLQIELTEVRSKIAAIKEEAFITGLITFKMPTPPEPPAAPEPPEVLVPEVTKEQIKAMQAQEAFAIKMSAAEQKRLNERYELEQEINAKIYDELLSDTEFRLQELDKQFLAADSFVKDKAMLDEWYVENYEEIMNEANSENLAIQSDFNSQYAEMGKSRSDIERMQVRQNVELWEKAGIDKEKIAKLTSDKLTAINKAETKERMDNIQSVAGTMADGFKMVSEMGGKHSKEAFAIYKAFKITETIISTYSGAMKAYESLVGIPYVGPALGVAAAAAVTAFGMAQVSSIQSAQPSSYDQGGISHAGGIYQTGDIDEAHIPIPSGGKIPVRVESNESHKKPMEIHIHEAPGTKARVEQSEDGQSLEVIIEQVEQSMQDRMNRGTGMAPFMDGRYGRAY